MLTIQQRAKQTGVSVVALNNHLKHDSNVGNKKERKEWSLAGFLRSFDVCLFITREPSEASKVFCKYPDISKEIDADTVAFFQCKQCQNTACVVCFLNCLEKKQKPKCAVCKSFEYELFIRDPRVRRRCRRYRKFPQKYAFLFLPLYFVCVCFFFFFLSCCCSDVSKRLNLTLFTQNGKINAASPFSWKPIIVRTPPKLLWSIYGRLAWRKNGRSTMHPFLKKKRPEHWETICWLNCQKVIQAWKAWGFQKKL
jgi:hypothetical protein